MCHCRLQERGEVSEFLYTFVLYYLVSGEERACSGNHAQIRAGNGSVSGLKLNL